MTISDLLTLTGILLAILAFISERNREYIFLKYSKLHIIIIVIAFLYVNFLLSYNWWKGKLIFLSIFNFNSLPTPSAWAYLISILILFWAVWRIFRGKFPIKNKEKLMKYYEKLLLRNDIAFLSELIEKYHLKNVIDFLKARKTIKISNPTRFRQNNQQEYKKQYKKLINSSSRIYGEGVFYKIILNDTFIDSVANIKPYLFASVIRELNTLDLKNEKFVNRFLKILIINKNGNFFREIRNNQNLGKSDVIEESRPILYSLFYDINVASINQAWQSIGEQAILEMQEEAKKTYSPLRESDKEQDNDTTWSYRITIAIWYFDIMVRKAIEQDINNNMYMFYYKRFVKVILDNMEELPGPSSEKNRNTRNFDLLEKIFLKMIDWKEVVIESKHSKLVENIYDCIGQCLYEITSSNKLNDDNKNYLMNWVWEDLIKSCQYDENGITIVKKIIKVGFEMFKQPYMLFNIYPDNKDEGQIAYLRALSNLWKNRDTSILHGVVGKRANRFKTEVIDTLLNQEKKY